MLVQYELYHEVLVNEKLLGKFGSTDHRAMSLQGLARVCVALCALSTAFPVVASLIVDDRTPRWLGVADVIVAAAFCGTAIFLAMRVRNAVADRHRLWGLRLGQLVLGVIPVLLFAYLVIGGHLNWTVLIIGLAWRAWLLLYTLPFLLVALQQRSE